MIRAVVTGGTGFIGKKLTNALAARGWLVTVLTRDVQRSQGALHESVRLAGWNPRVLGPWVEELEAVDAVINLAGEGVVDQPWTKDRLAELKASRVDVTHRLSSAIAQTKKKPKVLISASAVGIYGMRKDDEVLGEDGSLGDDVLAELCKSWERAADPAREAGVRAPVNTVFARIVSDIAHMPQLWAKYRERPDALSAEVEAEIARTSHGGTYAAPQRP